VADIWGFAETMEKQIGFIGRKPQISTTTKGRSKFTLRERLKETPEPHSRNLVPSLELIEKLPLIFGAGHPGVRAVGIVTERIR